MFLRKDALALGYNDQAIAKAVRQGQWHRVRNGAFVPADVWSGMDERARHRAAVRAVLAKVRCDAVASHVSAAVEIGGPVWDLDLSTVHFTRLDRKSGRQEAGVSQHRGKLLAESVIQKNGIRITNGTRTALDITTITDVEHALVVVNGLLHKKATSLAALEEGSDDMAHWPFSLSTDLVLRLADPRIESAGESRVRYVCFTQGVPSPEPQVWIFEDHVAFARVDFAWPERKVFLEFDGKIKYTRMRRPKQTLEDLILEEKQREERICEVTGWRCIRVTWADLADPARLAARIRRLFTSAPSAA